MRRILTGILQTKGPAAALLLCASRRQDRTRRKSLRKSSRERIVDPTRQTGRRAILLSRTTTTAWTPTPDWFDDDFIQAVVEVAAGSHTRGATITHPRRRQRISCDTSEWCGPRRRGRSPRRWHGRSRKRGPSQTSKRFHPTRLRDSRNRSARLQRDPGRHDWKRLRRRGRILAKANGQAEPLRETFLELLDMVPADVRR